MSNMRNNKLLSYSSDSSSFDGKVDWKIMVDTIDDDDD